MFKLGQKLIHVSKGQHHTVWFKAAIPANDFAGRAPKAIVEDCDARWLTVDMSDLYTAICQGEQFIIPFRPLKEARRT